MLKIQKGTQSSTLILFFLLSGRGGIRTPGASQHVGFQDRYNRPLCHPSIWFYVYIVHFGKTLDYHFLKTCKESLFNVECWDFLPLHTLNNDILTSYCFLSLLSDSNQRPRDYKSRALANWAKEALNVFVKVDSCYIINLIAKDICFISYSCMFVVVSLSSQTITGDYT